MPRHQSNLAAAKTMVDAVDHQSTRARFLDVRKKLDAVSISHPTFGAALRQSFDVVGRALDEFGRGYEKSRLAISFNGGKDACVSFYLLLLILAERDELDLLSKQHVGGKSIPVVYFEKEEFPEMEAFMAEVAQTYGFEFVRYSLSYKDGMQDLVDSHGVKGVIMGQRRGDPWTETMETFTPSTPGWAEFTRINPALEWKYGDVWRFLRASSLPYCCLYDQGYTSLGERGDTAKNEALRLPNGEYRPAYDLAEEHLERSPRTPTGPDDEGYREAYGHGRDEELGEGDIPPPPQPQDLKHLSTWDQEWGSLEELPCEGAAKRGGVSNGNGEGPVRPAVGGDSGIAGGKLVATSAGGGAEGARQALPRSTEPAREGAGAEVVELTNSMAASKCVPQQTEGGKEHAMSTPGWVGGSMRWLPVTALVALVLATVGIRRPGSPHGGDGGKRR